MKTMTTSEALGIVQRSYAEWLALILNTPAAERDTLNLYGLQIATSDTLRSSDREGLFKALSKRLGCTIKALKDDLAGDRATDDKELDDRHLAELTLDENLKFSPQGFFLWRDSGVWAPAHDREIRQRVGDVLQANGLPVASRRVGDVFSVLKDCAFDNAVRFDEPQHNRVNVQNGTLELEGGTWTLREHRREDFLTQQLPAAYDPGATCPRFDRFLQEIFAGDEDATDKALLVREMLGYCLVPSCRYEKFFLLIGQGSNGKSVLLRLVEALIRPEQRAAVEPSRLGDRFQRGHLRGKLVNLVAELPTGSMLADDAMKAFTSGDSVTAEHKGRDPFDYSPFATFVIGTNNMPHSRDLSRGMFRRAMVIRFNQNFEGREDFNLSDKLVAELPGILASALQAYAGVVERGGFSMPKSCTEAVAAWKRDCDTVAAWVHECCTIGVNLTGSDNVRFSEAYDDYCTWCQVMGVKSSVSGRAFGDRLEALGAERYRTNGARGFHYLRLTQEP